MTEARTLPVGVEYGGQIHRELEIGPRKVKHLLAASGSELVAQNKDAYEICVLAEQIIKLGAIPKEEITGALLLEMDADDFDVLTEAAQKVRQRTATFRGGAGDKQAGDSGPA
ncbi:MAG: hypothetical protein EG826_02840 [Deltaproteobacteria bacterium]|nr:hypothetical protein [Deltaproteobacteria bacterium]